MAKLVKPIRFEQEMIDAVQAVADSEHGGNYTAALESLVSQSMAIRSIEEQARWMMYSGSKRLGAFNDLDDKSYTALTSKMTTGLHIQKMRHPWKD